MRITHASLALAFGFISLQTTAAFAVLHPGDILVNLTGSAPASNFIQQYSPSGTLLQTYSDIASGTSNWLGASINPAGQIMTTFNAPTTGVKIFNPDGTLAQTFNTPQIAVDGDIAAFADGNIAICDPNGSAVQIYSSTGTFLNTIPLPGGAPVGSFLAKDNTLWIGDGDLVDHITESGTLLNSFTDASADDLALDSLGNVWAVTFDGIVFHWSPSGTLLSNWSALLLYQQLAIASDDSLYIDSGDTGGDIGVSTLYHYSPSGTFLDSFPLTPNTVPVFLNIVPGTPEPATLSLLALATPLLLKRRRTF